MTKAKIFASAMLGIGALAGCWSRRPNEAELERRAEAVVFIQEFYEWYHPAADSTKTIDDVLGQRPTVFDHELRDLLVDDRKCASGNGEVCSLDFDPILNSQDPCEQYTTGQVFGTLGVVVVGIFPVCNGVRDSVPAVRVMLAQRDSTWEILNLLYPAREADLKSILSRNGE